MIAANMMFSSSQKKQVLERLLYSEVFKHPLTANEISAGITATPQETTDLLSEMVASGLIFQHSEFYGVFDPESKIERRQQGMERAQQLYEKALKTGRFIHGFPFVKGVGISGSLSKGILHQDGDFDFFIITQNNRLWVARTLLILYKKLFLLNSKKYFCVNYFIDDKNLEIEEKNLFTATEIHSLIPVVGNVLTEFHATNEWVRSYYPGAPFSEVILPEVKKPWFSRLISGMLKGRLGEWTDKRFMHITFRRWKKKFSYFQTEKFELTLKTRRYISKHHPSDFQTKVLNKHRELIALYKTRMNDSLQSEGIEL
ncbi:MAG: nucleotidyltransferase domain-containing protein [Fluviicola sp.]|nr:nucleotidyltransferase domain-containing protein [Fluviicola sp.]